MGQVVHVGCKNENDLDDEIYGINLVSEISEDLGMSVADNGFDIHSLSYIISHSRFVASRAMHAI